jgi:hypothetical protein
MGAEDYGKALQAEDHEYDARNQLEAPCRIGTGKEDGARQVKRAGLLAAPAGGDIPSVYPSATALDGS